MKTAITDRTLSYIKYNSGHVTKQELEAYTKAVFACGADYIELNADTAKLLDAEDYSERFILNVRGTYDIGYCSANRFAYVTIPFAFAHWIDRVPEEQPVILEVNADEYSAQAILMYLRRFSFITRIAAVRLTGVMSDGVEALVKWCSKNYFTPVDICPLNTMMTGSADAVSAADAGASMITLSFGRGYYYTSMEQYLINVNITRRTVIKNDVVKGICAASLLFTDIFGMLPTGLASLIDTDNSVMTAVYDIESGVMFRPYRVLKNRRPQPTENTIERRIKSIGLEHDIETAILDMFKKVNFDLYKEITKRNIID